MDAFSADPIDVRNFLDSKCGRHLADDLHDRCISTIIESQGEYLAKSLASFKRARSSIEAEHALAA